MAELQTVTVSNLPNAATPLTGSERVPMDQTVGSSVAASALVVGTGYRIETLGTTNWTACGLPAGVTAAVGLTFVATAPGTGTGTAIAIETRDAAAADIAALAPGTNLAYTAATRVLSSSTGDDVTLPLFGATLAGLVGASGGGTINYLRADGTWAAPPGLSGSGTVTSVGLSAPTGFSVSGSPITTTGTLSLAFASGYSLPTDAKQTDWDAAFTQRRTWDGGDQHLNAATGRASLGLGTAAVADTGTAAGNVVVLDGSARLPAVDGSLLIGLPASFNPASPGAIGGTTPAAGTFTGLGLGTAALSGWELVTNGGMVQNRSTLTAIANTYSLDVTAANEFLTGAAIAGATTINLANLETIPSGYLWRGVLTFSYTSGAISWFTGNSTYTVKWDGNTAMTLTAGEVEKVVIEVVGGTTTIEIAPLKGRT